MTDPQNPAPQPPDAAQPTPSTPPPAPAYGEYAPPPAYQQPAPPAYPQPGAPAYQQPAYQQPAYAAAPAYAGAPATGSTPGKTLGIVAFVLALVPIGLQLVGLILGIVALVQSKKAGRGNGFAIAAIILGALAVLFGIILIFAFVVPSVNAATTCLNDPTGTVTVWGVQLTCEQVLEQSNR